MAETDGFGFFGVVKEIGVDDEGLAEFATKYYPGRDLYLDEDLDFYKLLGERKIPFVKMLFKPLTLYRSVKDIGRRHAEKGIQQNLKGEGLMQGGVIVFDGSGKARYSYLEVTGDELPTEDILAAISEVKETSSKSEL
mmetsp:Transcript_5398/g.11756  ORF Transcript_5398/g.11756 Transcript_5398/m.11756 type:complete len:138 (-) Transcript_5398:188-601(-)